MILDRTVQPYRNQLFFMVTFMGLSTINGVTESDHGWEKVCDPSSSDKPWPRRQAVTPCHGQYPHVHLNSEKISDLGK